MGRDGPPGRIGTPAARCGPKRLPLVEIAGCPHPEPFSDEARPVDSRCLRCEIRNRWQRAGCIGRSVHRGLERLKTCRTQSRLGNRQRGLKIGIGYATIGDPLQIPATRHGDRRACDPGEAGGSHSQTFVGLAEERIDRDTRRQWPSRRDRPRGLIDGRFEIQRAEPGWRLGQRHSHSSGKSGSVGRRQPPSSRSNTALA